MNPNTSSDKGRLGTLALAALGVVYGDIGTSPLYTMKEVFAGSHPVAISPDNVVGILSLIFWALILVVSIKYVAFVLRADNRGEGGIMALMALALRGSEEGQQSRFLIMVLGIFGAALFYGDGVVTPAISVLSAVEGIEVATPAFKPYIIPLTLLVLLILFIVQRKGTASVGTLFGPVMCLWFATLAILGLVNIVDEPRVLAALNPLHGLWFFVADPWHGFLSLGAVVLALTGAEALYADMGHFGRRPIQVAWFGFVLPALALNYFGQGALLIHDPKAVTNPFYLLAPEALLYPMVVLSTAATVIASQAVISGAFSMTRQAIQLGYSPRMEVRHTSGKEIGQIYLPGINWLLMIAVAALVVGFKSSTNLAAAYGIAVTGTMVITTILAFIVVRRLWNWGWLKSLALTTLFLVVDVAFFAANAIKIEDGGWFPLVFGLAVFTLMTTWRRGRKLLSDRVRSDALPLEPFVANIMECPPTRVPGTAVFMTPEARNVPFALLHSLKHYKVLHERVVFLSVAVMDIPHVGDANRVVVEKLPGAFYRVKVFYGFMDEPDLPEALEWCADSGLAFDMMDTTFFLGRETLIPKVGSKLAHWRELLFIAMFRNASSATAFFKIPSNRVVELGSQIVL